MPGAEQTKQIFRCNLEGKAGCVFMKVLTMQTQEGVNYSPSFVPLTLFECCNVG